MTLTALVAASLVGSAQAYACKSDGQCKYPGCEYGACYWWWDGWDYDCRRTPPAADRSYCNDPPPCPPGQYSIGGGKNGGSDYACRSCEAGKFQSSAGAWGCDNCLAGKYAAATASTVCSDCTAGKYSATAGVESVCVVCVCVFSKKKKRDTYTLYHTQFIHNTYKWRKHKSVSTNNRLVSYTHSLSIYRYIHTYIHTYI